MTIAVINQSTVISDADGRTMVAALNMVLPQFCKDWVLPQTSAVYIGKGVNSSLQLKVYIRDTSDVVGALGYHDERTDIPYGVIFAKTCLQYGPVLYSLTNPTVAQTLAHEVFELLVDLYANLWANLSDGETLYAYEVCDPVESNPVVVSVQTGSTPAKVGIPMKPSTPIYTSVVLSDWVLPRWFDPQARSGQFNHLNTIHAPFTLDKGGYAIVSTGGNIAQVFGERVTEEQKSRIRAKRRVEARL